MVEYIFTHDEKERIKRRREREREQRASDRLKLLISQR